MVTSIFSILFLQFARARLSAPSAAHSPKITLTLTPHVVDVARRRPRARLNARITTSPTVTDVALARTHRSVSTGV